MTSIIMFTHLRTYFRVWLLTAQNSLQEAFVNRWSNVLFLLGKCLRLGMSLLFLYLLKEREISLVGYTTDQVIVFFLTYQIVDVMSQVLYRGVYVFGGLIRSGEFDFLMTRPISPLFRALTGKPDFDDAVFMIPTLGLSFYFLLTLDVTVTWLSGLFYLGLLINSMLIVTALHILVLVVGVMTTEVDNIIWTYRDLSRLGQFPVTMYIEPLQSALFFILPIGLMITIPAQVLLNTPPTISLSVTTLFGVGFFILSLQIWNWGLRQYSSASS